MWEGQALDIVNMHELRSGHDSFLFLEPLEVQLLTAFVVLSIMHMPFRIPEGCLIA